MILAAHQWMEPAVEMVKALNLGPLLCAVVGAVVGALLTRKSSAHLDRQKRRLEKEYQIYGEMWETLFDMRRTIATVADLDPVPIENVIDAFNAYQAVVRRNEPFICESVYKPARDILTLGRKIIGNHQRIETLEQNHGKPLVNSEKVTEKQIALDDEVIEALDKIDESMNTVRAAIRARIGD